jgi:mono/diheme cytochrome c family protein
MMWRRISRRLFLASLLGMSVVLVAHAASSASSAAYDAACALCHQARGAGLAGQFPRLAGRVDRMAAHPESRLYLIQTVLYGLVGRIDVDGAAVTGVMPPFDSLSDADIASALNYLIGLGGAPKAKVKPFVPGEIAAARKGPRVALPQLLERRAELAEKGLIP